MNPSLARTPLHSWHAAHGGRLVDFAGWEMPVQYGSIVEEHQATRKACGLFDVSHMGRFRLDGPDADDLLDHLLTRRVVDQPIGRVRYALVTNPQGGIRDDVLVYHLQEFDGTPFFMLVVNASNRTKIAEWIHAHLEEYRSVSFLDLTSQTAMIAVQGPQALAIAQPLVEQSLAALKNYQAVVTHLSGKKAIVSRTGYTGEDGCELIVPATAAVETWEALLSGGAGKGARAVGLAARDTLRLEAAMPLYGHELSEEINPIQAGLEFAVDLAGRRFVGCDAVAAAKNNPKLPRRVGLELVGKRVPREHYPIVSDGKPVGIVTSGTFSPTFEKSIAMGYVPPELAAVGTVLAVDIRGRAEEARVVPLPFYRRS